MDTEHALSMSTVAQSMTVERVAAGRPTQDGAGVKLTRLLTPDLQRRLDPFLMLDAFGSDEAADYIAGFPDHPHRGFETITVMLAGRMRHRDSAGHEGLLQPGGVQWMTAGRGVIHSELPEQQEGRMEGFQLWLNLPAADKMCAPWYRDIADGEIARVTQPGVTARVIAGRSHGVDGVVQRAATDVLLLDITLAPGAGFAQPLPAGHSAFAVPYRGEIELAGTPVRALGLAILGARGPANGVQMTAGPEGARVLLAAGRPLREPIAQYGPFVMNTNDEIFRAVDDYRSGRLA
jgi:hypothetical protein